jgi:hypothetical protein
MNFVWEPYFKEILAAWIAAAYIPSFLPDPDPDPLVQPVGSPKYVQ